MVREKYWTRHDYLAELRRHLRKLPPDEMESAVQFYEEYLDEAGEEHLAQTLLSLGTPREVAVEILTNRTLQDLDDSPPAAKKGMSMAGMVMLAIFASPVALPLALVAAVVVMVLMLLAAVLVAVLCLVLILVLVSVAAVCIGLSLGGLACIFISLPLFVQSVPSGFFYLGSGMCAGAVGVMLAPQILKMSKLFWRLVRELIGSRLPRIISKFIPRRLKRA